MKRLSLVLLATALTVAGAATTAAGRPQATSTPPGVKPDLEEDFSGHASLEAMVADPRYNRGETFAGGDHGRVVLFRGDGYDGSDQSLRYEWMPARSAGRGGTLSVQLDVPEVEEIWVEWSAKFSPGYQLDFGYSGGAAYKFLFLNINNPPSGRIGMGFEGRSGALTFHGPDDVVDASHRATGLSLVGGLNDGRWHVYRVHTRLSPTGDLIEMWVDGRKVGESRGWNSAARHIRGITLGRNMNMAPTRPQWNAWGHVRAWWSEDPGWN